MECVLSDRLATLRTILDALCAAPDADRKIDVALYLTFECELIPPEGIEVVGRRLLPGQYGHTHMRNGAPVDGSLAPPYMSSLTDVRRLIEPRISPLWDWCVDRSGNANVGPFEARNCHYTCETPEVGLLVAFLKAMIAELEGEQPAEQTAEAA